MTARHMIFKPSDDTLPAFGMGIVHEEDGTWALAVTKGIGHEPVVERFNTREEAQTEAAAIAAGVVTLWL